MQLCLIQVIDVMPRSTGYGSVQFALDGCTDLGPPWGGSGSPAPLAVTTPIPVAAPIPTPTPVAVPAPAVSAEPTVSITACTCCFDLRRQPDCFSPSLHCRRCSPSVHS